MKDTFIFYEVWAFMKLEKDKSKSLLNLLIYTDVNTKLQY